MNWKKLQSVYCTKETHTEDKHRMFYGKFIVHVPFSMAQFQN